MTEKEALIQVITRMTDQVNEVNRQESLMKTRTPKEMHCLLNIPKRVKFTPKQINGLAWLTWLIHNQRVGGPNDGGSDEKRKQNPVC